MTTFTITTPTRDCSEDRWVVQVTLGTEYPVPDRVLDAMADVADDRDITMATRAGEPGLVFTAEVDAERVGQVPGWAFAIAERDSGYEMSAAVWLVDLRVCTPDVYAADALRPDTPQLLAATDVAELLGISRQRVHQLHSEHPRFPAPYIRLGSGPIWTRPVIEEFARVWTRKPGRPTRTAVPAQRERTSESHEGVPGD
jgi:predicted DNA-binding transcriptional regulator AlpA